ncbi:hypothetical protein Tco_0829557 [Tanacetum coccineum]
MTDEVFGRDCKLPVKAKYGSTRPYVEDEVWKLQNEYKERIKKTKRSKNSQKPTRNERDKNKSEESAKDQSRISPTQKERKSKTPIEVKGLKVTSSQSLKGLFEVLEFKGPKLPKVEKRFIKEEKEEENTRAKPAILKPYFTLEKADAIAGAKCAISS